MGTGILAGALVVSTSRAEDCAPETRLPHRVAVGAGYSGVYFNGGSDGHNQREGPLGSGQAGYAYSPERGLEVGADVVVFSGPIFLTAATLRGYVPIGARDVVELGLSGHFGLMTVRYAGRTSVGLGIWGGVDVRVWVTERFGLQAAGQGFVAKGETPRHDSNAHINDAALLALGGSLSVLMRN